MADEILATIACPKTSFTVTATSATLVDRSDMVADFDDFPEGTECRLVVVWKNSGTNQNNISLYDQHGAADISDSTLNATMAGADTPQINETSTPFTVAGGLKSLMVKAWVSAGTATIEKIELQAVGELAPEVNLENKSANMGARLVAVGVI